MTGSAGQNILLTPRVPASPARVGVQPPILGGASHQADYLTPPYSTAPNEALTFPAPPKIPQRMMLMKQSKIPAALLAATLLLSLAACGQDQGGTEPTPTADTVQIGLLLPGQEEDPYDQNHIQGLQAACQALGIDYDTQVLVRSNVPEDDTCADTIQELTEAGCQILFSAASGHETALIEAAVSHPDLPVCQAGGSQGNQDALDNTHTHYAQVYQAWYLAGIAAGQKTETNRLGYVVAFPSAQGISAFTAYYLGAKSVNDQVTMVVRYTNAWSDAEQETQLAQGLIDLGCDVLSYNTNTAATAEAAQANGVFVVGCHQDIAEVAPDAALTAVQIHWEAYYTYALTCLLEGEEIPQDWCGSYADGACGLTDLNASAVASGTAQAIQDAAAALEEGSLQVFAGPLHGVAGDGEVLSLGDGDYYTENQDSSTPTFHYIVDGITVLS